MKKSRNSHIVGRSNLNSINKITQNLKHKNSADLYNLLIDLTVVTSSFYVCSSHRTYQKVIEIKILEQNDDINYIYSDEGHDIFSRSTM